MSASQGQSPTQAAMHTATLPICVDLDGTLLKIDSLQEAACAAALKDCRVLLSLPMWLAQGKARLKQELARRWSFEPAYLPYNENLLVYLREQHQQGRRIVLVTAADRGVAKPIADYLGFFDEVIASDGTRNLRGANKAAALCDRFGTQGFVYAGNDHTDKPVWDKAAAAIVVNAPPPVQAAVRSRHADVTLIDDHSIGALRAMISAIRPHQWVKNILVFVPLLAAGDLANPSAWLSSLLIFTAFCAVASSAYLLNDMSDLAADRMHLRKRQRPFASGSLSIAAGLVMTPLLLTLGFVLGWASDALPALILYCVLALSYNLKIKEIPLIDVFVLAALYSVRLLGGGEASGHPVSLWLLGFSSFLFLSLALIKRVSELYRLRLENRETVARRGYATADLDILQMMGCAATFASAVVLSLYIQSDEAFESYARPGLLWGVIPLILFWQCRLWLATARGTMHDDPIVYAARDRLSWAVFACLGVVVLAARFFPS
jgi:4-hydroxybenzoate polyprenyltransferase/phosphoserine phosphatase